jgi:hypothetical protein
MVTSIHITPPPISTQAMADLLSTIVLLCRGKDAYDRDFWAYMCIKPSMAESFKEAQKRGNMCIGDFGTIIEAGEGTDAPAEVQQRMQRDYGVRHDYEEQLMSAIRKAKDLRND